jgi:hypothetical protein
MHSAQRHDIQGVIRRWVELQASINHVSLAAGEVCLRIDAHQLPLCKQMGKSYMVIPMYMTDEDAFQIPQRLPSTIRSILLQTKIPRKLTPCPFTYI